MRGPLLYNKGPLKYKNNISESAHVKAKAAYLLVTSVFITKKILWFISEGESINIPSVIPGIINLADN